MKSSRTLLTTVLLLGVLSYTTQAARVQCDPNNRPDISTCPDNYTPVCGYYSKNCPLSICPSYQTNSCYACADRTILYYETGECAQPEVIQCDSDICNIDENPDSYLHEIYFSPSCGIKQNCTGGNCKKTFSNYCKSCANASYPFFQDGPCTSDITRCPATRPTSCNSTTKTVCAAINIGNDVVYSDVSSSCNACKDRNVSYYLQGSCGRPENNQTYCLPNNRPISCSSTSNPVCGFYKGSKGYMEHKIISNACNACKETNIIYHTPGPCVFYCDRNPWSITECSGSLSPVCGTYKVNGVTKKISLRNSCLACYGIDINIDSYTEGLCPGDDGILCANSGAAYDEEIDPAPVCGLTTLGCTSKSCRKTYSKPEDACLASRVVKYIPGPCPGDFVSCANFRPSRHSTFVYKNVCGYTKKDCKSSSCRQNYADELEACKHTAIKYFTQGPC